MSKPLLCFTQERVGVGHITFAMLVISSFGPYLFGQVRLEHLLIYPLLISLIFIGMMRREYTFPKAPFVLFSLFSANLLWSLTSQLCLSGFSGLSTAALENYTQPVAISLIVLLLIRHYGNKSSLHWLLTICKLTLLMYSANSVIAILNMLGYLSWVETYFIRGADQYGNSVWQNSAVMGRYPGLFGQPFEAGLGYSIALICSAYIFIRREFGLLSGLSLGLVCVGGALSVSKVFIFIGVPIFLVYLILAGALKRRFFFLLLLPATTLFAVGVAQFSSSWGGFDYLLRLFDPANYQEGTATATIFANRFSSDDAGATYGFIFVVEQSLLGGFGFSEPEYALDSAFTEAMWRGGLVGLLIYLSIYGTLAYFAFFGFRRSKGERPLFICLLLITFIAGFGGPTFTVNRVSVVLIILLMVILALCKSGNSQECQIDKRNLATV